MNNFYRALISLGTVFPLTITFSYLYANWLLDLLPYSWSNVIESYINVKLLFVLLACVLNIVWGKSTVLALNWMARKYLDSRPVGIGSIKELGSDSLLAYLPYVLPLFIAPGESQDVVGWLFGSVFLFILSWASMTITFSPLLRLSGLRFFEATLLDKTCVTLLIYKDDIRPLNVTRVATISNSCYYGLL